jgi:choline dehydrogenase-like flavoprotein
MDLSYLPEACADGAVIHSNTRVDGILVDSRRSRATGVTARTRGGGRVTLAATRCVVLAASAVQTPALLWRSGIRSGPVGQGFQCHPGASMAGRFAEPVRMWRGATQGHEVTGLRKEGLKFESLGYDMAMVAARQKGVGRELTERIEDLPHWCNWGVAVKAEAKGTVRPAISLGRRGGDRREVVRWTPTVSDVRAVRRGVRVLGEMMLAAGAQYVTPGVFGWHSQVEDPAVMASLEEDGPLDPRAYALAVTHMFGTCRMSSDRSLGVVRPDFRHHRVEGLYVADSSVFPSNTGVNPQTSIIALAAMCAEAISG